MSTPLRALIVEDSENDAELLLLELRRGGYVVTYEVVETAEAMRAALGRTTWDVVIADYVLPHFSGIDALKVLKECGLDLPFIIVSGMIGEDMAVAAMRAGAHDYLIKGKLARLAPAIEREMREAEERLRRKQADEALRQRVLALTQPTQGVQSLRLTDLFDLADIQQLQDTFAEATGVASMITDANGQAITRPSNFTRLCGELIRSSEVGAKNCILSDAAMGQVKADGQVVQPCLSGGLWEGAARIQVEGHHVATWLIGQVITNESDRKRVMAYAEQIGVDRDQFADALAEIKQIPQDQFSRVAEFLYLNANLLSRLALQNINQARAIVEREAVEVKIKRQLSQLLALHHVDNAINSHRDLQRVLEVLVQEAQKQLGVDAINVLIHDPTQRVLRLAARIGFPEENLEPEEIALGDTLAGQVVAEGRTFTIGLRDARRSPRAAFLMGCGFEVYYGVPLSTDGRVTGVLEIFNSSLLIGNREWLDFLETLAGQAAIAIDQTRLFDGLQQMNRELVQAYDATLEGWSRALELRDQETEGHSKRVTEMALRLAQAVGVPEEDLIDIRRGALLHDIGKMGVPDEILFKPGKLSDEDWVRMRQHPVYAYEMLAPIGYLKPALDIPYCHHEKWDGSGYPRGLQGEDIPLAARIFAIIDVWDALRSDRPYRKAWSVEQTRDYIGAEAGKHFDPDLVSTFLALEW